MKDISSKEIIIVKIGTNLLTTSTGMLDLNNLRSIVDQIAYCQEKFNCLFIIVTSGAVTCGSQQLGIAPISTQERQAAAAVGQFLLMKEYSQFFLIHGLNVGQLLLTKDGFALQDRFDNIRNTINTLLSQNAVPIINENDSVSTEELDITFGDNDQLSSLMSRVLRADKYILLTDIDGVFDKNPKIHDDAELIENIPQIDTELLDGIEDIENQRSTGGMESKLMAAKAATDVGINVTIANGRRPNIISDILSGDYVGTNIEEKKGP